MAEINKILFKRGLETNRSGITPAEGEPIWVTDEKRLYIGDGTTAGGVPVAGTLTDLADTDLTTPGDGALLLYDTGTSTWRDADMSGDVSITDTGVTTIANDAVSYAKMQNVAGNNVLLGNNSGAGGVVDELTATEVRSLLNVEDGANNYNFSIDSDSASPGAVADGATLDIAGGTGVTTSHTGTTVTVALDVPSLTDLTDAGVLAGADTIAVYNASAGAHEEATITQLQTYMQNNLSFSSNPFEIVDGDADTRVRTEATGGGDQDTIELIVPGSATPALSTSATEVDITSQALVDINAGTNVTVNSGDQASTIGNGYDITLTAGDGGLTSGDGGGIFIQAGKETGTGNVGSVGIVGPKLNISGKLRLFESNSSAGQYVELAAPNNGVTGSYTFSFPGAVPSTNNDMLVVSTTGIASYETPLRAASAETITGGWTFGTAETTFTAATGYDDNVLLQLGTGNDVKHFFNATQYITELESVNWTVRDSTDQDIMVVTHSTRKVAFAQDVDVGNDLTVTGNLTVNGTTTTVNSTTVTVDDPVFTLGGDTAPGADDNKDRGIEFRWHNGTSAKVGFFGFDDTDSKFMFIPDATNTSEVFTGTLGDAKFNTIESTQTTGTAPFTVASTTLVTNLNADQLDGNDAADITLEFVTGNGASSTNAITISNATNATSDTTGALIVAGGIGVSKDINGSGAATSNINDFTIDGGTF